MARINLLPWRAERRKQREREFGAIMAAALALGALVVFGWGWYEGQMIDGQQARNQFLEQQIKEMDKKLVEVQDLEKTRTKLLQRKQAIEELQANRSQMVHLFDDLVRTIPDGVRLTSIKQTGDVLTLEGQAESNARVSNYMRNLEASSWVTNPDLQGVEAKGSDKRNRYAFVLRVTIKKPQAAGAGAELPAAANAPGGKT